MEVVDLTTEEEMDIVSIDIGSKHLAVIGKLRLKICFWKVIDLRLPAVYNPSRYFTAVYSFFKSMKDYIGLRTVILIERQMNSCSRGRHGGIMTNLLIESLVYSIFSMKSTHCFSISPKNVSALHNLEKGKMKKKSAVSKVELFLKETKNTRWLDYFMEQGKRDDLADAYLQAIYYEETGLKN